jgi:hypothetical protein
LKAARDLYAHMNNKRKRKKKKAAREKHQVTYKSKLIRITIDFLTETLKSRIT